MKTTKLFFMAALALMTAACSNDDNDLTQQPAKAEGIPFTATISLDQSATTRALTENGTTIEATWATGEKVALIYTVSATTYVKEAEVTPQGDGTATISTTLEGSPADNTDVTIVYPASAVDGTTKDVKTNLLASQNGLLTGPGSIAEKYELRKTTTPAKLKIDGTTASLKGTVSLTNQFAIWKLTTPSAKNLCIMANGVLIAEATLASPGTEFYVAVPAVDSKTVAVVATNGSSDCWSYSKDGVSLATGNYYQSSPKMTALGTESSADVYKMTGAGTIPDGKTVVLSDVTISSGQIACSGDATIILMGDNTVTGASINKAAIKIGDSGTTLTITGSGSLTATGGNYGAGIGTDNNGSGGNIVINGGTVNATGGSNGAGIGTGRAYNATNTCGDITINGGMVTATGGNNGGAGIGTGASMKTSGTASNECGAITIGTGVTRVTANKSSGNSGPNSIGKGRANGGTQTCGTITIGGTIYWDGSDYQNDGETYLGSDITYPTAP